MNKITAYHHIQKNIICNIARDDLALYSLKQVFKNNHLMFNLSYNVLALLLI
jgi:hypothetical protein